MRLHLATLNGLGFEWMRARYGEAQICGQATSHTRDDMFAADEGGLSEDCKLSLAKFIDSITNNRSRRLVHNYVKLLDGVEHQAQLRPFGDVVERELRLGLKRMCVPLPSVHWSLWMGGAYSATSMHKDYQDFSLLHVIEGAKRLVLIDPTHDYPCTELPRHSV